MELRFGDSYQYLLVIINLGYLLSVAIVKFVENFKKLNISTILEYNAYRLFVTTGIMLGSLFFIKTSTEISRMFILVFYTSAYILLFLTHSITRRMIKFTFANGNTSISKAVILGAGLIGKKLHSELNSNIYLGVKILGFFDDDPDKQDNDHVLGTIAQAKDYIKEHQIDIIYCTLPLSAKHKIMEFLNFAEQNVIEFYVVPAIAYYNNAPVILNRIGNIHVLTVRKVPLSQVHNAFIKRGFDIIVSFMFLITLFPVIYLVFGTLIKLSSQGPVFFMQERTGLKGKNFKCYKFRSMKCNDEAHNRQATVNDSRTTRIGKFMRRTSIDELPQFINVLRGEMSIVGPRPHPIFLNEKYARLVEKYMVRHFVKPGITGLAQINGLRGETKEVNEMEERIKKDIRYIENWSVILDLEIIFKTIFVTLVGDKKAY
jgi:putative colanic acid biosynthesis UDP-glucose lipid carrier transferase